MKSVKILATITAIFIFTVNLRGAWYSNWPPPPPLSSTQSSAMYGDDINNLIVDGASNMLQAYSAFILFINESELSCKSPFNFPHAGELLDDTIQLLDTAKNSYTKVLYHIDLLVLPSGYIENFRSFDYTAFAVTRKLNPLIMARVKSYLEKGDIAYYFARVVNDLEDLMMGLTSINSRIKEGSVPDPEELRPVYEKYSDCMLLGYYSSLVFSEIK